MPYTPTSWTDLGKEKPKLQELFREITCFKESNISKILEAAIKQTILPNPPLKDSFITHCKNNLGISDEDEPLIESCWDFVNYQLKEPKMCNGNTATFTQEGFQIGSPWHGDILQAPVLFLSFNPAVTQNCLFPRWHIGNHTFTFAGQGTPTKDESQVYEFFRDRLTSAYIDNTGAPNAQYTNGNNFPVSYWRGMYKTMNILAGIPQDGKTITDHCHRLMRSVLSAEIIFFGSKDSKHATDIKHLLYFWDKFTVPMLKECGAKIIFLTGGATQEAFHNILLPNGGIYTPKQYKNKYGQEFVIAAINHIARDTYKNYDTVAQYLHDSQPEIVNEIQNLYNA